MSYKLPQKWMEYYVLTAFVKPKPLYSVLIDYLFFNLHFS